MAEVVTIRPGMAKPAAGESDLSVVELLEELLEEARAGSLRGVAYASVHHDGSTETAWAGSCEDIRMLGAVHKLAHRYTQASVESD